MEAWLLTIGAEPAADPAETHRFETAGLPRWVSAALARLRNLPYVRNPTDSGVGPEPLTGVRVAQIYSQVLDREVRYGGDDLESWGRASAGMLPDWLIPDLKLMYGYFQKHGLKATREDFELQQRILGRPPKTFEAFAAELAAVPAS